jgi:hypothetical protein
MHVLGLQGEGATVGGIKLEGHEGGTGKAPPRWDGIELGCRRAEWN